MSSLCVFALFACVAAYHTGAGSCTVPGPGMSLVPYRELAVLFRFFADALQLVVTASLSRRMQQRSTVILC
jgi:hypothetical protein